MGSSVAVIRLTGRRSGSPVPVNVMLTCWMAAIVENDFARACQSWRLNRVTDTFGNSGVRSASMTISSGFTYGNGASKTAFDTVNTAVFAPMPSASVTTAMMENPGRRMRFLNPRRISPMTSVYP